jgi:hypothetical protein
MEVFRLKTSERVLWEPKLRKLEALIDYPFGFDRFRIDHGKDYFNFFDRLGDTVCYLAADGDELAAIGVAVMRYLPQRNKTVKAWYLCDLKVSPEFRGRKLTTMLFKAGLFSSYLKCSKAYCISMNPSDGKPNSVVTLLGKMPWVPLQSAGQLQIYSVDYSSMQAISPILRRTKGKLSYLSHSGRKDLILKSNNALIPLLHVQHGPLADKGLDGPQPRFSHMFCCLESDPLHTALKEAQHHPIATASLLHYNMKNCDWSFVLTSDL